MGCVTRQRQLIFLDCESDISMQVCKMEGTHVHKNESSAETAGFQVTTTLLWDAIHCGHFITNTMHAIVFAGRSVRAVFGRFPPSLTTPRSLSRRSISLKWPPGGPP